jgi:peptidoglycan/xylan/chitin deacetylase (PgdA/CDA1 family)
MPDVCGSLIRILPGENAPQDRCLVKLRSMLFIGAFITLLIPPLWAAPALSGRPPRVLLVIGDQWDDPASFMIGTNNELHEIASLLKNWGIPFDIVRLDQQRLDRNTFLDYDGKPRYGAILWDADPVAFANQNYTILADAVEKWNISLIALSSRINHPVLESLLGVHYIGYYDSSQPIIPTAPQDYLVKGLPNPLDTNDDPRVPMVKKGIWDISFTWQFGLAKKRVWVETRGAQVLATQADSAQITRREVHPGTEAIWIGGDYLNVLHYQALRTVLRRALTEAVGYQLSKDWTQTVIIEMDDQGSAQNTWAESWHYPTLTQQQIETLLIGPLEKHHAILVLHICPGFVDQKLHAIVPSFQQVFTDEFGTKQDYVSTKRGIDEGLKRGVFEIQSHGWTHIAPDLDSPPGPWWDAPLRGEKANICWYREYGDPCRGKDTPAAIQRVHFERSTEWIRKEFGVTPLEFDIPGDGFSVLPANNTTLLAAQEGFGYLKDYLGPDMAIGGTYNSDSPCGFNGTQDAPLEISIPPDGHDRGLTRHPEQFPPMFEYLQGRRYLGMNEYIAYLHAHVSRQEGDRLALVVEYDDHYCAYFRDHDSQWRLELPGVNTALRVDVDGKTSQVAFDDGVGSVNVPKGIGKHVISVLQ